MADESVEASRLTKVLVVQFPYWNCGPTHSMLQHLKHLDRRKFDVIMVCPTYHPFLEQFRPYVRRLVFLHGVRNPPRTVNPVRVGWYLLQVGWAVLRLASLIRRERVEIVHNNADASLTVGLAARLCGVPAVTHCRGLAMVRPPWVGRILVPLVAWVYDVVIAVSHSVRQALMEFSRAKEKLVVIHNGVDPERFRPREGAREVLAREFNRDSRGPWIGTIGGIAERKGQEYFIRAAAKIRAKCPDASFFVVGALPPADGPSVDESAYLDRLKALVTRLGLDGVVTFTGERADIPMWLNAFDVVVQPSLTEAGPRVPLEAMACGRAVVATGVEGNAEEVQDGVTGILVRPADDDAIATAVLNLLENPALRKTLEESGPRRVAELFSIKTQVRQIELVYRKLLRVKGKVALAP